MRQPKPHARFLLLSTKPRGGCEKEPPGDPTGIGHSMVVDPTGQVLLELGAEPDLAFVDVDPEQVPVTRKTLPVLDGNRLWSL